MPRTRTAARERTQAAAEAEAAAAAAAEAERRLREKGEKQSKALARAQAQHRKKQRVRRTLRPPIQSGLPAVLDEPCVAVAPQVKRTDARVRAFEAVFLPKIVSRANNQGRLERRSL